MIGFRYLLAFLLPASVYLGLLSQGPLSFAALIFAFGVVPFFEGILPTFASNLTDSERSTVLSQSHYDLFVLMQIPLHLGAIALFIAVVPQDRGSGDLVSLLGHITALGISCGTLAINVAHELGHRPKAAYQRLAQGLLVSSLYGQFFIDHNFGHHKHVGTPEDSSTARYGEVLYLFWIRSIVGVWRTAWRLKPRLMAGMFVAEVLYLSLVFALAPEACCPWFCRPSLVFCSWRP